MPAQFLSHGQRQWLEIGLLLANEAELLAARRADSRHDRRGDRRHRSARATPGRRIVACRSSSSSTTSTSSASLKAPVTVLHLGRKLREGSFDEIAEDAQVRQVYLGTTVPCLRYKPSLGLRHHHRAFRYFVRPRSGRDPGRARPQRHGQVDADPHDRGHTPSQVRIYQPERRGHHRRFPPSARRIGASPPSCRGAAFSRSSRCARTWRWAASLRGAPSATASTRCWAISRASASGCPARRHDERRRAADAGDRPRDHDRSHAHAAGRALRRHHASVRHPDRRYAGRNQQTAAA